MSRFGTFNVLVLGVVLGLVVAGCGDTSLSADPQSSPSPASASTCAPSFCVTTAAPMLSFSAASVPASQRSTVPLNPSLAGGYTGPRLFGAVDLAGNTIVPNKNDYQNAFQGAGDTGNWYNFNQWPYVGTMYYYNHQAMAVPPTGWINAAHRNGVPILGVLTGDCTNCATADNTFYANPTIAANQMQLIAKTYGFDGWLVDVENGVSETLATATMKQFRGKTGANGAPLISLFYEAGVCDVSSANAAPFNAAGYFQSDYCSYGTTPQQANSWILANAAPNNNPFTTAYSRYVYPSATGQACSSSSSQISNGANCLNTAGLFGSLNPIRNGAGYYQAPGLYAVGWERWGGVNGNPLNNSASRTIVQQAHRDLFIGQGTTQNGPECTRTNPNPNSVAAFVPPAGVALSSPFVTNFNTGEGDTFQVQGAQAASTQWNGLGLQDVQPTCLGTTADQTATLGYGAAYDGGSSLSVTGAGTVSLFATKLATPASPTAVIQYQGSTAPIVVVQNSAGAWRKAKIKSTKSSLKAGSWTASTQTLASSGNITAIGVQTGTGQTTIGQLAIGSASDFTAPPLPTQSIAAPASGDLVWQNAANTWYSNVYGCSAAGATPTFVGRTYQSAFNPNYTIQQPLVSYPKYTISPVTTAGIGPGSVACV